MNNKKSYKIHADCLAQDILDALDMEYDHYFRIPGNKARSEIHKTINHILFEGFKFYTEQHGFKDNE